MRSKSNHQATVQGLETPVSEYLHDGEEQTGMLRLIADAMPALIAYVDNERRYRFINKEYELWFGLERDEVVGRTLSDVLGEETREKVEPYVSRVLAGEDLRFETEIQYRKAGRKWVEARYIPDLDEDGGVRGFFALIIDITERKDLEAKTREQFEELENIYSSVPVGLAVIDTELRFVRVNEWLAKLNGVPVSEHAGRPVCEVVPQFAEKAQELLSTVIETGEPVRDVIFEGEAPGQPAGQRAWSEIWTPVKNADGETIAVNVVVEDITESRWAETLITEQNRLFGMIAAAQPLETVLTELTAVIDRLQPNSRSVVLVADRDRCEFEAAYAANIPDTYVSPLRGVKIEETPVGTCCAAVYRGKPVTSTDVASDMRWTDVWRNLCLSHDIKACHSEPIFGEDGRPMGTVVLGYDTPREPDERGLRLVQLGAQVAGVAIERSRAEQDRKVSESEYRTLFESIDEGYCVVEVIVDENEQPADYRFIQINPAFATHTGLPVDSVGKTARELVPGLEDHWVEVYGRVALTGEPVRFEQGSEPMGGRWFDVYALRVGEPEKRRVGILFNDVTERKRREADLALLTAVASDFTRELSVADIVRTVGERLRDRLGISKCLFAEIDEPADEARIEAAWVAESPERLTGTYRLSEFARPELRNAARRGDTVVVRDTREDARVDAEFFADYQVGSLVTVPFKRAGAWKYLFTVNTEEPRNWSEAEIELIREVAARVFPRIERARAEAALRLSEERLRLATAAAGIYTWEYDPSTGISYYSSNMRSVLGFELPANTGNANLYIHPHDRDRVMGEFAAFSDGQTVRSEYRYVDPGTGKTAWVATHGMLVPTNGRPARAIGITQNITERRLAEEGLRAGERERLEILESITDAFFGLDSEWRFSYTNRQAELVLEREPGSLIGKVIWDEYPGLVGSKFETAYRAAMDEGIASTLTDYYPDHDRWYEVHVYPRRSADGARGVSIYFQNATERVMAEQAIRESESTFRQLVEASPFGIFAVDTHFRLVSVSAGAQKVFENVRPLIGRDLAEALRIVWEEPFATEVIAIFRHTLESGDTYYSPRTVETRGDIGKVEAYDWKLERITMPDGQYGLVCHFYDLSERIRFESELREAELRFRSTFEQAAVGIAQVDSEGRWIMVNDRLCEIVGYTRDELLERSFQEITHPDDIDRDVESLQRTLSGEVDQYAMDKRYVHKDGEVVWVNLSVSLVREPDGSPKYFVSIVQDITEMKRAEATLLRAAARDDFRVKLADAIRTLDDPDEVKKAATCLLGERLGVNRAFHAEVYDNDWLVVKGYESGVEPMPDGSYSAEDFGTWIMDAYRRGERIVFRNSQNDPRFSLAESEAHKSVGVVGAVGIPLVRAGDLVAILAVHTAEPRDWSDDEIAMVEDTAERTWAAVERARAEKELIESEQRYRFATRATHDVIWDWDMVKDEVVWSDALNTVFGYPPDQAGMVIHDAFEWWTDKIHPDDRAHVGESFQRASEARRQEWYEKYRFLRADGTYADVEDAAFIVYDPAGKPIRITGAMSDVTERSRAEHALRASEDKYRVLFDSMDEGYCIIEMIFDDRGRAIDYRFVEVNSAFERQAGMQDVVGKRMLEFVSAIESHWLENYGAVARTGVPVRFANEYKGLGKWFDVYAFRPAGWDGPNIAVLFTDITERKLAEAALSESEKRFRNMADNAPVMIWVTEPDGYCNYLSESWYEFTGQTPKSGLGYGWLAATHPDDAKMAEDIFRTCNAKSEPFRVEYRLRNKDGEYRWVIDSAQPRFSDGGVYLGYIGSVIDIHERKEAEEQRRRDRERFDIVRDGAEVGFWFCDLPFDELIWDNRVKEHFWLSPDARVTIDTFYERIHPEDRERTRAAIAASNRDRTQYDIVYRTTEPSGEGVKWIRAIGRTFYDKQGEPIRFDGVTLDITEHKRAEDALRAQTELLRAITESTPDLIFAKDASGRMIMANKATLDAIGQTEETAIGRLDSELYDPLEADLVMANDRRVMRTGRTETMEEVVTAGGDTRTFLTTKNPLRDADGRVIGVVGVSHDITALKRAETALRVSETRQRLALEAGGMGAWTMPMDGGRGWADERTLALFDIPPEQWNGNIADIHSRRFPEDIEATGRGFADAHDGRTIWKSEFRVRHRDGSVKWIASAARIEYTERGEPALMRGIYFDITERKQAEEELRSYHEVLEATVRERTGELAAANRELKKENTQRRLVEVERQRLLRQLVAAQEQERRRIAQDLHDHLGQQLTALNLKLEIALQAADHAAAEHLHEAKAMMRQIDDDVDALAWQLRPAILDDDGFLPALRKYVEDWSRRYGIPAELWADSHFENHNGLSAEAETNLYRITQEALNNVAKYAHASHVEVLLNKRGDSAVLTVQDDGAGFDVAGAAARSEKSMGLVGMRERAGLVGGTFQIESAPGQGTAIYVRVPFTTTNGHDGTIGAAGSTIA